LIDCSQIKIACENTQFMIQAILTCFQHASSTLRQCLSGIDYYLIQGCTIYVNASGAQKFLVAHT